MSLRVLIVDDNAYFLDAARDLLDREGMAVVGVASNGADAMRGADELKADVILVDIDLGGESGIDLTRALTEGRGDRQQSVILMSAYPEEEFGDLIDESPAIAFLSKSHLSAQAIRDIVGPIVDRGDREEG